MKGFGGNIVDAIIADRSENGLYTDLFDFVERMSQYMSRKNIETLIWSGAFDSFGYKRSQFFLPGRSGDLFIDELVRYIEGYRNDTLDSAASLFGEMEEMAPERPVVPEMSGEEDIFADLQREKELVGMYLSSHPLDVHKFAIDNFVTTELSALDDLVAECEKTKKPMKVTLAGLVTDVKSLTSKTGKPWSKTVIEDYSGSYELAFFGKDYEAYLSYMKLHEALYIEGEIGEKYYIRPEERAAGKTSPYSFKVKKINLLGNVADDLLSGFVIGLTTPMLTQKFRKDLAAVLKRHPGKFPLGMYLTDHETGYRIQFHSNKYKVGVNEDLITDLRSIGVVEYEALKK